MELFIFAILAVKNDSVKLDSMLNGMSGISGADLHQVSFDEITAVVSDIDRRSLVADSANAIAFAGVIENLAQQFTLLPMRFGSIMDSAESITQMLKRNFTEIQQNLSKVENRTEFGLKVFCDSEKLKAILIEKSASEVLPDFQPDSEPNISVFREYVNKKLQAHRLEELLLGHVDSVIEVITEQLNLLNARCKFKKMLSEALIIDAVFLLELEQKDHLVHKIKALQTQYPGLNFILTGPWPPYNFVEITIK
jgi:hypothetical protein